MISIALFLMILTTEQRQHIYPGEAFNFAESLEFVNCKFCSAPTVKTKKPVKVVSEENKNISALQAKPSLITQFQKVTVYFEADNAELPLSEIEKISGLKGEPVRIIGYTDSVGKAERNGSLAKQRAEAVAKLLRDMKGVELSPRTIIGKELCCYADTNDTDVGRAKNRRAEIIIREVTSSEGIKNEGGESDNFKKED